jgi:hypothetical protein
MKATPKSSISMAVAAALIGLGAASVTSLPVQAQSISSNNTGQALIYPYYTVNGGWITTMNLINTSEKTLAVKVRFHEAKNSRDVLDFTIIMSPYDTWAGWVEDSVGGPKLRTIDNSCTSPTNIDGVNASNFAYTGVNDDTGGTGLNRMREGYIEVLVMGVATEDAQGAVPPNNFDPSAAFTANDALYVPYYSEHVDGEPRDCAIVDRAFIARSAPWSAPTLPTAVPPVALSCGPYGASTALPGSGYPLASCDFEAPVAGTDNPLKGNVGWLNASTGYGAGSEAIAVQDWSTGPYVTAQQSPWFLEPTFATAGGALWSIDPTAFEESINATATMNEWASNANNGARSDWVVAFPTKAFHVDIFNDQIQAASNIYRNGGANVVNCADDEDRTTCVPTDTPIPVAPFLYGFGIQGLDPLDERGDSKIIVKWDLYDREEGTVVFESDGTSISPAPPPDIEISTLKYEANVIQFSDASVLASNFPAVVDAAGALNGAPSGWAKLTFVDEAGADLPLPAGAFAIRAIDRSQDGQAYDSGYVGRQDGQPNGEAGD